MMAVHRYTSQDALNVVIQAVEELRKAISPLNFIQLYFMVV
jgi:hypothetical protein